jgi:hypothetical protein
MDCVEIHQMEAYQAKAGQVVACQTAAHQAVAYQVVAYQVEARQQELPNVPVFAATFCLLTWIINWLWSPTDALPACLGWPGGMA